MGTAAAEHTGHGFHDGWEAGPTVPRMVLGARLRRLREADGYSRAEAGAVTGRPEEWISTLELGRVRLRVRDVADLCAAYGVTDRAERATLFGLARQANATGWWSAYRDVIPAWFEPHLGLEQSAEVIRVYAGGVVPDLLRTEGYTRALLAGRRRSGEIDRIVALLKRRQEILHRAEPVPLWAVLDEAALRRPPGGRATAFAQLDHLIDLCDLPHVTLQILPSGTPVPEGPFTLLRPPQPGLPDVVYLERDGGARYPHEPAVVAAHLRAMDRLAVVAAPACATRSLLFRMLREP